MPTPSSTIRATFHNASLALKVRSSLVAGIPGCRAASTASLRSKTRHKSFYGQPVFPLSTLVFKLDVSPRTVPFQSVLAHLATALKQNMTMMGLSDVVVCYESGEIEVQPIISARQTPGSPLYLESVSLRYGFHRTEGTETPLSELLEECHQRLLGSLLIRRYPLVFGTWKFRFAQEQQAINCLANATLSMAKRSPHSNFQSKVKESVQKLKDTLTADGMDESTPVTSRGAIQGTLELLFINQIRPRVIKLDFTHVMANVGNLEDKDKDKGDPRSRVSGSATSCQTTVESQSQESTVYEDEADLYLLADDMDPDFDDSSGWEILEDRETEPDILVF